MKNFLYISLFIIPLISFSQNYADKKYYLVDSLDLNNLTSEDKRILDNSLKIYHTSTNDLDKINALTEICENMMHNDWSKYQFFQYKLIQEKLKNYQEGETKLTILSALAKALNNIGIIYNNQGDIPKSIKYFHQSLKILDSIDDEKGVGDILNNIGNLYLTTGDNQKALEFFQKSLKIREKIGDTLGIAGCLNSIGHVYRVVDERDLSLEFQSKSLEILQKSGHKIGIATCLNNIGTLYKEQGDNTKALKYLQKSIQILDEIGDKIGVSNGAANIGVIFLNEGNISKAIKFGRKSLLIAQEIGHVEKIRLSAILLYNSYQAKGDFKKALEMRNLEIKMHDSINNQTVQKAMAEQQAKYEYEKQKAVDDAEHEKQLAIEQEAKEKQQILTYATSGGLGLVGIFLIFVFNRLKITRKQKGIIEVAHTELEVKNQEITDSIQYAKRIQSAILPPDKVVKDYLQESFILYKPKDIVAGDFYWLESVPGLGKNDTTKVLFAAADCTGHGVPGAMVSVVCNNGLNRSVREYGLTDPGKILDKTREIVVQEFEKSEEDVKDGMDIALCSLEGNTLQYAGAHNPLWIIRSKRHSALDAESPNKDEIAGQASNDEYELIETKANKQPIGQFENPEPYTTHTIELQKGDSIYIFSDGYADQFGGEKGKKMKTANFKKLLLSIQGETMQKQKELINEAFESWKGKLEQLDDVCVIGVKI